MPSATTIQEAISKVTGVDKDDVDSSSLGKNVDAYLKEVKIVISKPPFWKLQHGRITPKQYIDGIVLRPLTDEEIIECHRLINAGQLGSGKGT